VNYTETIDYLYSKLPVFERVGQEAIKPGLQNIILLCEALGNPQNKFRTIHVAGTNGKGSTSHLLASVLITSGYKTGLHTSPHLKSFTERFKINGQPAPEQEIVDFVKKHQKLIEKIKPSFFEISVALTFDYFARQEVDIAVIEVGLGGRLDSTNIIIPILSIITNIGFDHVAILGDTLPKIAAEKAGIIKANVPVVISEYQSEITEVFIDKANACRSEIYFASNIFSIKPITIEKSRRVVDVYEGKSEKYKNVKIDLLGEYQLKNLAGVLQSVELLKKQGFDISEESIREGIENCCKITNFKGRWTQVHENPVIIADVAHNFEGLTESINQICKYQYDRLIFVLGFVKDKDVRKIMKILPTSATYYFCEPQTPRALPAIELVEIAREYNIFGQAIPDVNDALQQALKTTTINDFIYIGGSTFVVSELAEI
jgi:dihydrofolate synthase / folylpolyglutamate synthase